jgi:hypothetical protein
MNNLIEPTVVELLNKSLESVVAQKLKSTHTNQEEIKSELEKLSDTIKSNRKSELSSISQILKLLGKSTGDGSTKRNTTKISDNDIIDKLNEIKPSEGMSGLSIQEKVGITYARFNIFLERNPHFLRREGEGRNTRYFLQ